MMGIVHGYQANGRPRDGCAPAREQGEPSMARIEQASVRNQLLSRLSSEDFWLLAVHLQPVELELRQVVYRADEPIESVYFPEAGMTSHLASLNGGEQVEIGLTGREGMVGVAALLGADRAANEVMVQ